MLGQPPPRRYARIMSYFTPEQKLALHDALREQLAGMDSYELLDQAFAASSPSDAGRQDHGRRYSYLPARRSPGQGGHHHDGLLARGTVSVSRPSPDGVGGRAAGPAQESARGTTKFLLKQAMVPWLPRELVTRRKQGFGVPMASWLRTELHDLARDVLTDSTARSRGLFRPEAVSGMLVEHDQGHDHARRLWALIQFELWHRTYIDTPAFHPAAPPGCRPGALSA